MSRIPAADTSKLGKREKDALAFSEQILGFTSNDSLVMARNPALMHAFAELVRVVYGPGKVDPGLKRLVGLLTSTSAGCNYCMGHTAHLGLQHGVGEEKLEAAWQFEQSALFSEAERAALRVAMLAGQSPNGVTDEDFAALRDYYDEDEQLEIVAVIAMFGFLNRWNSTLATELETAPEETLATLRK